jgi:ADP-dependent phosphofructokinase/glucokinase
VGEIVLGLGGTVDFEVRWEAGVLERLAAEYGIGRDEPTPTMPIVDERSLVAVILAFLATGSGGERFVESSAVVETFAARFDTAVTLGGTGVRAGIALDSLGIPSVQHLVSIDDNVRRLLPASTRYISSATRDTLDPHLIVQYPAGARVRLGDAELVAPQPNRLIFANDPPNRSMALSTELPAALENADVFLVSGFNTMTDEALLRSRLDALSTALESLPADALLFYEDAGFYHRDLAHIARARLLPRIDVYSMNEDELQEYVGREVDLLDPAVVAAALGEAHALIPAPALVVHTRYWAIAVGPEAARQRDALESAVRMAATRYRLGDGHTAADFAATAQLQRHAGGADVVARVERELSAAGVPAYVAETATPTTIGLGDTFVGGFLAAVSRAPVPQMTRRPT